ncbi:Transmembrane BAX inhibitor motif-containing protein 4 [Perkinsus olseni]|uniref:Transmembrane BAX inhibitor motif-containing protein 4 n=1 Tax=Perkinsus olseni TaxID=32597 RepID=A0A7J6LBJ7_PEROL|nr:Transmembrane BAX inhibitor motif-containing protein 4 [Perkinsus olseni]
MSHPQVVQGVVIGQPKPANQYYYPQQQQQQQQQATYGYYEQNYGYSQTSPPPPPAYIQAADVQIIEFGPDTSKDVRNNFIKKVYGILCAQLVVTSMIAFPFVYGRDDWALEFVNDYVWVMWLSMAVMFATLIVLVCVPKASQKVPINYILLFIFTASMGLMIGFICVYYDTEAVLIAAGSTAAAVFVLTLFAFFIKTDFTGYQPFALVLLMVLVFMGLVMIFLPTNRYLQIVYGSIGALVFSIYLVIDTQMIVGGKNRRSQLGVDQYIAGALMLYMDIINLFLFVLTIVGAAR